MNAMAVVDRLLWFLFGFLSAVGCGALVVWREGRKKPKKKPEQHREEVLGLLQTLLGAPDTSYTAGSEPTNLFGAPSYDRGQVVLLVGRTSFLVCRQKGNELSIVYRWAYDDDVVGNVERFLSSLGPDAMEDKA